MQLPGRTLTLICLFIVLVTAIGGGWYVRGQSQALVLGPARKAAESVNDTFTRAVWLPQTNGFSRPLCRDQQASACPDLAAIRTQGLSFFNLMPLAMINVYTEDGALLLSIGGSFTSRQALDAGRDYFTAARKGAATQLVMPLASYTDYAGRLREGAQLLRLFTPAGGSEVVEVVYDMTPDADIPLMQQWLVAAIILGLFGVVYLLTRVFANSAEDIITTQHEEQAGLIAAKAKAEAENVEKSKFLANVSHELRTPLNSIIGFSEMLKDEVLGGHAVPQYKEYATDIHASGTHLLSLINDILDFSKADAGKLEVQLADVDITKLMLSSLRLIAPRAESANVQLIPDMSEQHVVARTDSKRLKQVVLNLLSNAVKFTPPGGRITLSCGLDTMEGICVIAVRDTGVGIAEKDISKVMAPFGQVENEYSSKAEGTGLGLPLTRKLVELMGGTFAIESRLGEGTTVILRFPYKPASHPEEAAA